jgi:hypothetical protein
VNRGPTLTRQPPKFPQDVRPDYLTRGFSIVPVARGTKRPLIAWRGFQTRRATEEEVRAWFQRAPDAGVAIVCGRVSALAVLDFDPRHGDGSRLERLLPLTAVVESGGGGRHYYFRLRPAESVETVHALLPGVDLLGEHALVTAPPSVHPSGQRYRFARGCSLDDVDLAQLPPVVRDLVALHHRWRERMRAPATVPGAAGALTLDVALSRLAGVRRCGTGWVARCPAHEDREPSLSIAASAGGQLLLYCFAGMLVR